MKYFANKRTDRQSRGLSSRLHIFAGLTSRAWLRLFMQIIRGIRKSTIP